MNVDFIISNVCHTHMYTHKYTQVPQVESVVLWENVDSGYNIIPQLPYICIYLIQ